MGTKRIPRKRIAVGVHVQLRRVRGFVTTLCRWGRIERILGRNFLVRIKCGRRVNVRFACHLDDVEDVEYDRSGKPQSEEGPLDTELKDRLRCASKEQLFRRKQEKTRRMERERQARVEAAERERIERIAIQLESAIVMCHRMEPPQ